MVLSHPQDLHATTVIEALTARGVPTVLFDLADLPQRATISLHHGPDGSRVRLRRADLGVVDLTDARSVWWRRPQLVDLAGIGDDTARGFAYGEWHEALNGLYTLLTCPWLNSVVGDQLASHKANQLALAPQFGLVVPETLMTSDEDEAREFAERLGPGNVVYKIFAATHQVWRETRILRPDDLEQLGRLRWCPTIFQRCVPGVADIRVTAVGDQLFAMAIDGRDSDDVDFRLRMGKSATSPITVPDHVASGLRALMRHFGIVYGGADFRLTPEGEWVFLEINPAGEFLFVEYGAGHPITDAVAGWLADPVAQPIRTTSTSTTGTAARTG